MHDKKVKLVVKKKTGAERASATRRGDYTRPRITLRGTSIVVAAAAVTALWRCKNPSLSSVERSHFWFANAMQECPGLHCPCCCCPNFGMNAKNRMCRLSAAKSSKWAREPPCEWLASTPALVTEASQEQTTRRENWGEYYNDPDSWPQVQFACKQVVFARYLLQSERRIYNTLGSVIGVYCKSDTNAHVYHLSFNLRGCVYYGYCTAENVTRGEDEADFSSPPRLNPPKTSGTMKAVPKAVKEKPKFTTASQKQSETPAVFPVGTRVFVDEVGGLGSIADYVRSNKRIDGYKVSYTKEPDFKEGEMESSEHSCAQVFRYLSGDVWVKQAIKRHTTVRGVHGFNTDSGKSTEITGEGSVVGLCVDVRSRPWFYAVFMRSIEVFYFSVADVTECDTAAAHKTPVAPVQLPAQQQAQPILYSSSAQAAAAKTPSANANVEDLYDYEEELRKADEEALEADTGDVESEGDNTHEAKKQADPVHVAGGGKQKHTHWIHNTRIACLRLIRSRNPFASRDSGLTWQQIAEEIHKDTEGITEINDRGKVKDCQVQSNGQSLLMWYRRQLEGMEKAFSDKSERSTSGQGGLRQKAISVAAQKAAESEENIQKEWDVLASIKALHEDAVKEAKSRKEATAKVKDLRDNKFPDAIEEMACESSEVMLATIKELHRRKRLYEQRAATLQGASRMPIMTDQQKKDFELLERLKKHRRDNGDDEVVDEGDTTTDGHVTSDKGEGRGKSSMYKQSFQNMNAALGKLTAALDEDGKRDEPVTAVQLKRAFATLDAAIEGGLELEAGERQFVREQYLRRFARI